MSVTFRFSALSLGRAAAPRAPPAIRSFSTSPSLLITKHNRVGKQTKPKATPTAQNDLSATPGQKPPVNTEAPFTSREPAEDNAPASSAEVPPNAEMPPPPPKNQKSVKEKAVPEKPAKPNMDALMASIMAKPQGGEGHRYDAVKQGSTRPVDLEGIIGDKFNMYMEQTYNPEMHDPTKAPLPRTAPVTGRTVFIAGEYRIRGAVHNPEAAFRKLDTIMGQNRIKMMFHQQRFQERAGMKRKRLKMVRWKKRFRVGFIETTRRVKELKKQGW